MKVVSLFIKYELWFSDKSLLDNICVDHLVFGVGLGEVLMSSQDFTSRRRDSAKWWEMAHGISSIIKSAVYSYEARHRNSNVVLHLQGTRPKLVQRGRGRGQCKHRCVSDLTAPSLEQWHSAESKPERLRFLQGFKLIFIIYKNKQIKLLKC